MIPVSQTAPSIAAQPSARVQIPFPRLLDAQAQRWKRAFDIALGTLMAAAALPLAALIALAIVIDSGRPVFFSHTRIGRGRRRFRVLKFRTMVRDAGRVLEEYLAENPERAIEWKRQRKLKQDPRVTRVGRVLRRTSLDELPQLWNVLRGEMSLIGPRPITEDEIPKFGPMFPLYTHVAPGLTGLWQVSGRNDTSYQQRVEMDSRYIRHWSLALDFKILLRTVRAVVTGRGAY